MASTRASSVYDRLQKDILTGQLKPGEKLRLKELIDAYQTGNSPLREALNRLSSNGLVVREENRGFSVPAVSLDELEELVKTRCWLEERALRESLANGDQAWEEDLVLAFHWLKQAYDKRESGNYDDDHWVGHHSGFHNALLSACGSRLLLAYCDQLQARTYRYRNLAEVMEYRHEHEQDEHTAMYNAALERDGDKAVELLKHHFWSTFEVLRESGRFD
ncbi:MAG: GntR family transcriptional regulator [Pseudomonadota bacterium]